MIKIDDKELNELFIELKHNNKIAFEKLYTKYNKLVYCIAFSILKNKEDSEDVVQIVFSKLYKIDKNKLQYEVKAPFKESYKYLFKKTENYNYQKSGYTALQRIYTDT